MYASIHTMNIYACISQCMYRYEYFFTKKNIYMCIYICIYIYVYMHIYVYIHICMYML